METRREGTALKFIDPYLRENCQIIDVMKCIHIGLLCVQENASSRPTMASVILVLNNNSATIPLPSSSAFLCILKSTKIHLPWSMIQKATEAGPSIN